MAVTVIVINDTVNDIGTIVVTAAQRPRPGAGHRQLLGTVPEGRQGSCRDVVGGTDLPRCRRRYWGLLCL